MRDGLVVLFGGSGFLGRYAARALVEAGWRVRVACRRPHVAGDVRLAGPPGWVDIVQANISNRASIERALEGADAVVNLVGILFERGPQNFPKAHAEGARLLAEVAAEKGIKKFVHVSAIADYENSKSEYAATKWAAEEAVRGNLPSATLLRPSIVFGPEDQFFNRFAGLASSPLMNFFPALPAMGGGKTRFQPVYAGDVAKAISNAVTRDDTSGKTYQLGGPRIYTFNEIYDFVFKTTDRRRFKFPLPFFIAQPIGYMFGALWRFVPPLSFGWLGMPPFTGDQVELLRSDNVVADGALTIKDLGLSELETVESIVPSYLWRFRPYGEFHQPKEA